MRLVEYCSRLSNLIELRDPDGSTAGSDPSGLRFNRSCEQSAMPMVSDTTVATVTIAATTALIAMTATIALTIGGDASPSLGNPHPIRYVLPSHSGPDSGNPIQGRFYFSLSISTQASTLDIGESHSAAACGFLRSSLLKRLPRT